MFVVAGGVSHASAHDTTVSMYSGGLRHAFAPKRDSETGQVVARINNWSSERFTGYVCAQEKYANGHMHHIGCLWADLAPVMSGGDWAIQFTVPASYGSTVSYTYQAAPKVWKSVPGAL